MSGYKTHQLYLTHRGRRFHFVSYEGIHSDPARGRLATPAAWFLIESGKRWEVVPEGDVAPEALESRLIAWLEDNVFSVARPADLPKPPSRA